MCPYSLNGKALVCTEEDADSKSAKGSNYRRRKIVVSCRHCSAAFNPWRTSKGIFCSNKCQMEHRTYSRPFGTLTPRSQKRIILAERGHRCEYCLLGVWQDAPIPLDLHHVDGNSNNTSKTNLALVCLNCHALTATWKAKNKGNGRTSRR